jgi:hypothetical protein
MGKINLLRGREAVVLGLFGVLLLLIAFVPAPLTSSDWAAWVQGTGTIAAVVLASWIRPPPSESAARPPAEANEPLENLASWVRRATADLELAILDADFKRVRDAIGDIQGGRGQATLEALLRTPLEAWRSPARRTRALELRQAMFDLGHLLPEPDPADAEAFGAWWEALLTATARLRRAAEDLTASAQPLEHAGA